MDSATRKLVLTTHVTFSVGWLGAVGGFLALAVAGLASKDVQVVHAAYLAMPLTTWWVIVPLAFASLLTGLVVSFGTHWGLFRHYWVVGKLLINILATILLLLHTRPIDLMAKVAKGATMSGVDAGRLQIQLVADAGAALLALLVATSLAVYKPQGLTPYGRRKLVEREIQAGAGEEGGVSMGRGSVPGTPRWVYVSWAIAIVGVLVIAILHLTGRGLSHH